MYAPHQHHGVAPIAVIHGSHPHPLALVFNPRAPPASHLCTLCQAMIDTIHDSVSRRCVQCQDFWICSKCLDIEETPSPGVYVRDPTLSPDEDHANVRTRPRHNAYVLCPIPAGELIEVVAYAERRDEGGTTYLRRKIGGWVDAKYLVCVSNAQNASLMPLLVTLHMQQYQTGGTPLQSQDMCLDFINEIYCLMNSPAYDFAFVMALLSCLPLQTAVDACEQSAPSTLIAAEASQTPFQADEQTVHFLTQIATFAAEMLDRSVTMLNEVLQRGPSSSWCRNVNLLFYVRLCGRLLSLLWHIPPQAIFNEEEHEPRLALVRRASDALISVVMQINHPTLNDVTAPDALEDAVADPSRHSYTAANLNPFQLDLWKTVATDNASCMQKAWQARNISWALMEVICHLHLDMPADVFRLNPSNDLNSIRIAMTIAQPLPENIALLFCKMLSKSMEVAFQRGGQGELTQMQWNVFNTDASEFCVKIMKHSRQEEGRLLAAMHLLTWMCVRNIRMINIVSSFIVPQIVHILRACSYESVVNAAFDLCAVLAYNSLALTPERPQRTTSHATDNEAPRPQSSTSLPYCTARMHGTCAPFQPAHVYTVTANGNRVSLCSYCAESHAESNGLQRVNETIFSPAFQYFVCQCETCLQLSVEANGHNADGTPFLPPPTVPLTHAQKILASSRILSAMTQRLRTHTFRVANSVGRLSMTMCCNEDVAQALFCALVERQNLAEFEDAAVAVAACQYFPRIQFLVSQYSETAIATYLRNPFEHRGGSMLQLDTSGSTPQAQKLSTRCGTESNGNSASSGPGLTPGPMEHETSPRVQLFPPRPVLAPVGITVGLTGN